MSEAVLREEFEREAGALLADADDRLAQIGDHLAAIADHWTALMRGLHRLKGACGMMRYADAEARVQDLESETLAARAHSGQLETRGLRAAVGDLGRMVGLRAAGLEQAQPARAETASVAYVSVRAVDLDRLLECAGELAVQQAMATHAVQRLATRHRAADADAGAAVEATAALGKAIAATHAQIMDVRLVSWAPAVRRAERLVADLGSGLGKRVTLTVEGGSLAVDRSLVEALAEPLLHLVRNALDHGIEPPAERRRAGKPEVGRLWLRIEERGDTLAVTIADDGGGIDAHAVGARAAALGVDTTGLDERELRDLVFHPYLSTASRVTPVSGRGMGLHAARAAVEEAGGMIHVNSTPGRGAEFHMRLPLAVTLRQGLLVESAGEVYAVPLAAVNEILRLDAGAVHGSMATHRGRRFPVATLSGCVGRAAPMPGPRPLCLVVGEGAAEYGVLVDNLGGQRTLVVGKLDPVLGRPAGVLGVAPLADGQLVMVLDAGWLARRGGDAHTRSPRG